MYLERVHDTLQAPDGVSFVLKTIRRIVLGANGRSPGGVGNFGGVGNWLSMLALWGRVNPVLELIQKINLGVNARSSGRGADRSEI